jgi:hypothetical protein
MRPGGPSKRISSSAPTAANQPDTDAFDRERRCARIDNDRFERAVLGLQNDLASALAKALDGDLVAGRGTDARDDDLAVARFGRAVHGEEIAVEAARVAHALTAHAQQIIRARRKKRGVDAVTAFDVLAREDRIARGHATYERQRALHRHAGEVLQAQAARRAGEHFDCTLARQGLQVILSRARRGKTQSARDFRSRGRHAGRLEIRANPVEDLALPGGELRRPGRGLGGKSAGGFALECGAHGIPYKCAVSTIISFARPASSQCKSAICFLPWSARACSRTAPP